MEELVAKKLSIRKQNIQNDINFIVAIKTLQTMVVNYIKEQSNDIKL